MHATITLDTIFLWVYMCTKLYVIRLCMYLIYHTLANEHSCMKICTIQYKGECGHIEGHAYSVLFVHDETCVFWVLGFHVYMSLIIASCTPENIIQNTAKPLNNMHSDTLHGGRAFVFSREVVLYTYNRGGICPFSEVILYYK